MTLIIAITAIVIAVIALAHAVRLRRYWLRMMEATLREIMHTDLTEMRK